MFENAREKAQKLGALAGIEITRMACTEGDQALRHLLAELEPEQRIRTHQAGAAAEERRVARDLVAQHHLMLAPDQRIDRAAIEQLHALHPARFCQAFAALEAER